MVASATMASWILPSDRKRSNPNPKHHLIPFFFRFYLNSHHHDHLDQHNQNALKILAFDTAKTISTLISLYRALSDDEIARLRSVISSRGVSYLNSEDEAFLLALACAERLEDLDRVAVFVSQLGARCNDEALSRFELAYRELKLGYVDLEKVYNSIGVTKEIERSVEKTERLIASTVSLYEELDALSQMEASERRLNEWKQNGRESMAAAGDEAEAAHAASVEAFEAKIAAQRKLVRHLKDASLWAQSFDKTVGFAARVICVVFARMCVHFGPYVTVLPRVKSTSPARGSRNNDIDRYSCHVASQEQMDVLDKLFYDVELLKESHSGPISGSGLECFGFNHNNKASLVHFGSEAGFGSERADGLDSARAMGGFGCGMPRNKVFQAARPSTVGGSGLALRYANIITVAEEYIRSKSAIKEKAKNELYEMLPAGLRAQVRAKLNKSWREVEEEARRSGDSGEALAAGWREASREILNWLVPVARDTHAWLDEQSLEAQRFDAPGRPTVLLVQTLHFSDLEKTETAVAEVLVGLCCIYRFENRALVNSDGNDVGGS